MGWEVVSEKSGLRGIFSERIKGEENEIGSSEFTLEILGNLGKAA